MERANPFEDHDRVIRKFFPLLRAPSASYLANFSTRWKYLYLETPKVGCTTVKTILQRQETGVTELSGSVHDRTSSPLLSPQQNFDEFLVAIHDPTYIKFSFVRNPFSKVLSCYLDKFCKPSSERDRLMGALGLSPNEALSFRQFLLAIRSQPTTEMDIHWLPQSAILTPHIELDVIGRFEAFDSDLRKVVDAIFGQGVVVLESHAPHRTNAGQRWRDYIERAERDLIVEIYDQDFTSYCYSRDPRFV